MEWQLQDAKNRFSELVQRARQEGPQVVTLRGRRAAVVLSAEAYDALLRERPSLVDHLLAGPSWDDDFVDAVNLRAKVAEPAAGRLMFLLDTNVVSEARRRTPAAVDWLKSADPAKLYLSVITLGEIARGVAMKERDDRPAAGHLTVWLETLRREFADRILPVTDEIALEWGRIAALRPRGDADGLIAATAIVHNLVLVTRNEADFADTRAAIINPWQG